MKKTFYHFFSRLMMLTAIAGVFASCSKDEPGNSLTNAVKEIDGLVELSPDMIGSWDEGYVTSEGYVLAKGLSNESVFKTAIRKSRAEAEDTPGLTMLSADKTLTIHLFFAEDGLPSQLVTGDNTLYFNFLNDEVLELVLSTAGEYKYLTTVNINVEEFRNAIANGDYQYFFQTRLAQVVYLLDTADIPATFKNIVEYIKKIIYKKLAEDPDATVENLINNGLLDEEGNATFVEEVTEKYNEVAVTVHYQIMLWTGQASFKVGGTSCTLSGTVKCASPEFNDYGTYGIVCDTDPEKLYVENAEYSGTGYQDGISTHFDVDFRGLKAKTTYYYRAYYKFNGPDHGNLSFKYGEPEADICYDTVIKEFTTGENRLTVDVVMCIDATGSMYDIINTVKNNAIGFYDAFNNKCVANGIELAGLNNKVISFRDKNVDGSSWWSESKYYSLPAEKDQFDSFVNGLYADGGGDYAESGLEALEGAFSALEDATDDGYHRQVVILWTDAPYLIGSEYTSLTVNDVMNKWETLSSGRRLILFAPNATDVNGGSWEVFDGYKNVIHSTSLSESFTDFDYILDSIIEELIGKGTAKPGRKPVRSFPIPTGRSN